MATTVVSEDHSPRESTSYAPSEPLSTSHLAIPNSTTTPVRGRHRSASATTAPGTTLLDPNHPPPLDFHFKLKGALFYLLFLIVCNVVVPCVIYYPLRELTDLTDKTLIGIGSAALGVSSCFDAPFRMWKLTRHRAKYGPLYYPYAPDPAHEPAGTNKLMKKMPRSWWHLDFFMWTYQAGLFVFAIPLAIAPAIPLYNFFLFSFAMLVIPIGIIFFLTLKSWHNLPFWMSSDPPRTSTKPAVYYFIEDIGAVDFGHGREWRKRCQARYAASPPFRALMKQQTLYWAVAMVIFVGVTAIVDWISTINVAFGVVISLIFMWAIVFGIISYLMVHRSLQHELKWWKSEYASLLKEHHAVPPPSSSLHAPSPGFEAALDPATAPAAPAVEEKEFLGEKGLSKPGHVAQGRHRGWSVHARLAPTPEPSIHLGSAPTSLNGGDATTDDEAGEPEMVQLRDAAGRTVAMGQRVPLRIAEGDVGERERGEVRSRDFAAEAAEREGRSNGSVV